MENSQHWCGGQSRIALGLVSLLVQVEEHPLSPKRLWYQVDKIFHVFVSSTYSDLIDERKKVSEAVAKAGFVAEGMEIFPASSQKQMDFIERVIDRCDYYILIVAGRYGSVSDDGLSYTEQEFRYAQSLGIPILTFIRSDIEELPGTKTDKDPEKQRKLDNLISELKSDTMVDFWSNPDELSTKALAALSQARVSHKGVGWIRANIAASSDILSEINNLRKENAELLASIKANKRPKTFDGINLAGIDEEFEVRFTTKYSGHSSDKSALLTWRNILTAIGPGFRTSSNTSGTSPGLEREIRRVGNIGSHVSITPNMEDKERILMQMEALGMMNAAVYNLKTGGRAVFHQLTDAGLAFVLQQNVVKSTK